MTVPGQPVRKRTTRNPRSGDQHVQPAHRQAPYLRSAYSLISRALGGQCVRRFRALGLPSESD
jgi:hypothetical protein